MSFDKPNQKASFNLEDNNNKNLINIYEESQIKSHDYFLCQPSLENISVMFLPLMKFVQEIDEKLELDPGTHCLLYSQLKTFANTFIKVQLTSDLDRLLDFSVKSLSNFTSLNDINQLKKLNLDKPLLLSTAIIIQCLNDIHQLMIKLPLNRDEILMMAIDLLNNYKENCFTIYKLIVEKEEEKKIISANWVKDEDINRCLKSLPNWMILSRFYAQNSKELYVNNFSQSISKLSNYSFDKPDESPEEVQSRNKRETELLISNITQDSLIPNNEVLNEVEQLKNLAQLQKAMEFLGFECIKLAEKMNPKQNFNKTINEENEDLIVNEDSIEKLIKIGKDFIDLSETCLLVLHLEVRVHCFYYLLPMFQQSFSLSLDNQEIDQEVLEFNKNLALIDEQLSNYLQIHKLRYIFEGLSHLVSTILINNVVKIKRINENGIKRMCKNIFSIQQQLTSITLNREVALDYCRQYYELFSNKNCPEDLLSAIMEKGIMFEETEYVNAIYLMHRSLTGRDTMMLEGVLKRLKDILKK